MGEVDEPTKLYHMRHSELAAKGSREGFHPCRQRIKQESLPRRVTIELEDSRCGRPKARKDIPVQENQMSRSREREEWEIKLNSLEKLTCFEMKDIFERNRKRGPEKKDRFASEGHPRPAEDCIFYLNSVWILFYLLLNFFIIIFREEKRAKEGQKYQ